MTPDDWLAASRDSMGPGVDARTRLMGRLAALGPPQEAVVAKRRIWPWVVATATLAAALLALWARPDPQRLVDTSAQAEQASDQASLPGTNGVALPKTPSTATQAEKGSVVDSPTEPESVETSSPDDAARSAKPDSTAAKPRNRGRSHAPEVEIPATPTSEPDASDTLAAEAALITRARAALSRGDASDALKRLREYGEKFDAPHLGEEAAALRAMARCALEGPDDESVAAFGREFPRSMFRKRVRRACTVDGGAE